MLPQGDAVPALKDEPACKWCTFQHLENGSKKRLSLPIVSKCGAWICNTFQDFLSGRCLWYICSYSVACCLDLDTRLAQHWLKGRPISEAVVHALPLTFLGCRTIVALLPTRLLRCDYRKMLSNPALLRRDGMTVSDLRPGICTETAVRPLTNFNAQHTRCAMSLQGTASHNYLTCSV